MSGRSVHEWRISLERTKIWKLRLKEQKDRGCFLRKRVEMTGVKTKWLRSFLQDIVITEAREESKASLFNQARLPCRAVIAHTIAELAF